MVFYSYNPKLAVYKVPSLFKMNMSSNYSKEHMNIDLLIKTVQSLKWICEVDKKKSVSFEEEKRFNSLYVAHLQDRLKWTIYTCTYKYDVFLERSWLREEEKIPVCLVWYLHQRYSADNVFLSPVPNW